MFGIQTLTYVVVPHHGPLSLYTKLEDASIPKLDFYFPQYGLWMIFNGPYILMSWLLVCVQSTHKYSLLKHSEIFLPPLSIWVNGSQTIVNEYIAKP